MIDTLEQFDRVEEAIAKMKQLLLVVRCTHTPEAYGALSTPILRELQECQQDILVYPSRSSEVVTGYDKG